MTDIGSQTEQTPDEPQVVSDELDLVVEIPEEEADDLEVLRQTLAEAKVTEVVDFSPGTRNNAGIVIVTLEGGQRAFWKRGDTGALGTVGVRREVAAYEIALLLDWEDLLQAVALRQEPGPNGEQVEIASVELLPDGDDNLAVDAFPQEQVERAAALDAIMGNSDRSGHNWRGIPTPGGHDLKLYDHELAFAAPGAVNSTFWKQVGEELPPELRSYLSQRVDLIRNSDNLKALLSIDELNAVVQRMELLGVTGKPC